MQQTIVFPGRVLRQSLAICRRNLLQLKGDPLQALDVVMPMLLAGVFISVFGGAIGGTASGAAAGADYKQYLLPGIMIQAVSVVSMATGIGLNMDFDSGMMDRFRSISIARSSVLVGRIAADLCRMTVGLALVFLFSLVIGFRPEGGAPATLASIALMLAFGVALAWISAFIGLAIRSPQTVQSVGFAWLVPVQFASSLFVPTATMPDWLRPVIELNPITLVCDACRNLMLGVDATAALTGALLWIGALIAVFAPASVVCYSRRS
ncbi:ABC transporter permease [Allokutzneria albata]|uniref:ABC transporter permease n=1 Tax=Allokutzneria albata TaxID=211114 RepID=UPI0004C3849A|nr:ABC transporter permease [Allokutzneria albata]